ncbi:MAG: hypothetical protein ACREXS_22010 [Gammaproteobacteria bacterium]
MPAWRPEGHPSVSTRVRNRPGVRALARTPEVEVLPDHLLEEDPSHHRPVEHVRQGELPLPRPTCIAIPRAPVVEIEGMRQHRQPFA